MKAKKILIISLVCVGMFFCSALSVFAVSEASPSQNAVVVASRENELPLDTNKDEKILSKGDVNGDDVINASDALMTLQEAVGLISLDTQQKMRADVNGDAVINATDALEILQCAVGIITAF